MAEFLIAQGADVNAKDNNGATPLLAAHSLDMIKFLVYSGADVNATTSLGQTPIQLAIPRRNTTAIEVPKKHRATE